ncbi:Uncharacterised protein [Candidatus Burarchaeum australiense]|nr:Uncharacterised protein [Candidatus Burarchaeum australiense]
MPGLKDVKRFLADRFHLYLVLGLLLVGAYLLFVQAPASPQQYYRTPGEVVMDFFYMPTCPHCHDQMQFHAGLVERHPNLTIIMHDLTLPNEQVLLAARLNEAGMPADELYTPTTFVGGSVFIGFNAENAAKIEAAVERAEGGVASAGPGSLPPLASALWVLAYLVALAMVLGDRRRISLMVGAFVLAAAILGLLLFSGWPGETVLLGYVHPLAVIAGLAAVGAGLLSLRGFGRGKGRLAGEAGERKGAKILRLFGGAVLLALGLLLLFAPYALR